MSAFFFSIFCIWCSTFKFASLGKAFKRRYDLVRLHLAVAFEIDTCERNN